MLTIINRHELNKIQTNQKFVPPMWVAAVFALLEGRCSIELSHSPQSGASARSCQRRCRRDVRVLLAELSGCQGLLLHEAVRIWGHFHR